jgi:hypothetical protein
MGKVNYPVTTGTSYTLRLERVGFYTRVFVNGELQINGGPSAEVKGRVGLMTYRLTAEFDDFVAYQPW